MGRLRSRKFLIIPTRQYFYKDTKKYTSRTSYPDLILGLIFSFHSDFGFCVVKPDRLKRSDKAFFH